MLKKSLAALAIALLAIVLVSVFALSGRSEEAASSPVRTVSLGSADFVGQEALPDQPSNWLRVFTEDGVVKIHLVSGNTVTSMVAPGNSFNIERPAQLAAPDWTVRSILVAVEGENLKITLVEELLAPSRSWVVLIDPQGNAEIEPFEAPRGKNIIH